MPDVTESPVVVPVQQLLNQENILLSNTLNGESADQGPGASILPDVTESPVVVPVQQLLNQENILLSNTLNGESADQGPGASILPDVTESSGGRASSASFEAGEYLFKK